MSSLHTSRSANRTGRFTPRMELLEGRDCPAVAAFGAGGILTVIGDNTANTVAIADDGAGNITVVGDGVTSLFSGITTINVDLNNGNDTFDYALTAALNGNRTLDVSLDKGMDSADIDASQGVSTGRLVINANGNDDVDSLSALVGTIAIGALADVQVNGGKGSDTVRAAFEGELDGTLRLKSSAQDGNDTAVTLVDLGAGSTGSLSASGRGGKDGDTLTVAVTGTTSTLSFFEATLDGDEGADTSVGTTPNVRIRNLP